MKIHQNWLVCPILLLKKKKDVILPHISVKEIFEEKKKVRFGIRTTLTKWTFFSIGPIWMIFMEGRVNTCYFLDFETFLKKKGNHLVKVVRIPNRTFFFLRKFPLLKYVVK